VAEIRSTLDIIMERTKGMALSQNEKDQLRMEDFDKRANGLQIRLTENPANSDEILSSLASLDPEDKLVLEKLLWKKLVQALPTDRQVLKLVPVLRKLGPAKDKTRLLDRIESDLKNIAKIQSSEEKKVLAREKKKLASFGISGTAVIPKISGSSDVGSESRRLMEELRKGLLEGV
jgi:hypothetical protein